MKWAFTLLAFLSVVALLVGFLGHMHPAFDAIAIGRRVAIYSFLLFLFLIAVASRRLRLAILPMGLLLFAFTINQFSGGEDGPIRIYSKNLLHSNAQVSAFVDDVIQVDPDIVFLQEVSQTNRAILTELQSLLPHQSVCVWQGWNSGVILSRWPIATAAPACSPHRSLMAVKVDHPSGAFWAVNVHLQQPWPDVQWEHLEKALPVIEQLDAGAIVAGDFNTVPWTAAARKIGQLTRTKSVDPQGASFDLWGVGLPLDQVWARAGRTQIRPHLGSDHRGVVADVWPSER